MTRGRALLVWIAVAAVAAALLVVGLAGRGSGAGRQEPALPREALLGAPVTLASLLGAAPGAAGAGAGGAQGGGPLRGAHGGLVLFWASWCTPCQREAPAVERFARSAAGRGRIVGIDYGESERAAPRAFVRRYGWSFASLSDPDAVAGEAYRMTVLPMTFVIDPRGRIAATLRGPQTQQSLARALAAVEG
jgi:thiol-disulfide isomerase/thioredoxin